MPKTGIILLAAGASTRLGRPKQLIPWNGETLLRHAANVALTSQLGPVVVVLGAVERECRGTLTGLAVQIAVNPAWAAGMGGSISTGMLALQNSAEPLDAVIIMLCDQPHVTPVKLRSLSDEQQRTQASVVAARYRKNDDPPGVPALFTAARFSALSQLSGPIGAKKLIAGEPSLAFILCPEAASDIDTPDDLARAQRNALG
ncbi:MAG TPA: nucleotidyltransferase family protein [Chthoniobacterales bacterium]